MQFDNHPPLRKVGIGIVGTGTVGQGTLDLLAMNQASIQRRLGVILEVTRIGARRDPSNYDISSYSVERDILNVARAADVDIVVELIGGTTTARELVLVALQNGKHVVTANKALIAEHGEELYAQAHDQKVSLVCEAAVAGGIPIMKALRESLAGNEINWLAGIINGTSNFILTAMAQEGKAFATTLQEAQQLGYAEADPTFDIDGIDAAHKLCILASTAFGIPLDFKAIDIQGIGEVSLEDIQHAQSLGYVVKHLGIVKRTAAGIDLRVHPTLIPADCMLGAVNGVMNGILVNGNGVGSTLYSGAGAGALPTGSAVVADIMELARSLVVETNDRVPPLGFAETCELKYAASAESQSSFYLRFTLSDTVGALAKIATTLTQLGISIEALLQKEPKLEDDHQRATLIILTHEVNKGAIDSALDILNNLDVVESDICVLRLEHFS